MDEKKEIRGILRKNLLTQEKRKMVQTTKEESEARKYRQQVEKERGALP